MKCHISILGDKYRLYFSDLQDFQKSYFFINPFGTSGRDLPSENLIQEQFIDLVNDRNARHMLTEMSCSDFWIEMAQPYPDISKMALKVLIPFPAT